MFVIQLSYISTLQVLAYRCHLPLVSIINEIGYDGTVIRGIEIELPLLFHTDVPRRFFFWSTQNLMPPHAYEDAAFQAINFLQNLYGFTIHDYSYQVIVQHRHLMRQLFSLANQGAQLARMVIGTTHNEISDSTQVLHVAEQLIQELDSIINPG
jgi:hypothetical protein